MRKKRWDEVSNRIDDHKAGAENVYVNLTAWLAKQLKPVIERIKLLLFTSYRFEVMLYL